MMTRQTLSIVIVAQNEERIIGRTLDAIKDLADEIVVVDSGSTDRTQEIAKSFGARVLHQDWLGYSAQKNHAIGLASSDWILSLDSDEVVTPQLVAEIKQILTDENRAGLNGFKIPRVLIIGDRQFRHGGFYPDAQLRLFRKGSGRFEDRIVHEAMTVDGVAGVLENDLLHYAYTNIDDFAQTMDKYARLSAKHYYSLGKTGWRASLLNEAIHPIWTFIYRFIFRGGFLDGITGARLNLIYSGYVRKKINYLRQLIKKEKK
jgi:glycosyltransferase involved in cell wall biosynthesis